MASSVQGQHADWLVPDWPAPPGVHALCTTRAGGVSRAPYAELNLGAHVGDDPQAVVANRQILQSALQSTTPGARAVFLNQVHGDGVALLDASTPDGTEADACVASAPGAVCTIMVADCLPVLLAHRSGQVVAAAHAGWRGLAGHSGQGVLESVFKRFCQEALVHHASAAIKNAAMAPGSPFASEVAAHTLAWLGPCIGPTVFEIGPEVRAAFCDAPGALGASAAQCFAAGLMHRANSCVTWQGWPGCVCKPWASLPSTAMTAPHRGVPSRRPHGSFRTAATALPSAVAGVLPPASGAADAAGSAPVSAMRAAACSASYAACSAASRALILRLRDGVPRM